MDNDLDAEYLITLILTENDSHMPTAINQYFGKKLFNSVDEYIQLQKFNFQRLKKAKHDKSSCCDPCLSKQLIIDNKKYNLKYIFQSNLIHKNKLNRFYDLLQRLKDGKYILHLNYNDTNGEFDFGHFTCILKLNNEIQNLDADRENKEFIPFTKCSLNVKPNMNESNEPLPSKIRSLRVAVFEENSQKFKKTVKYFN